MPAVRDNVTVVSLRLWIGSEHLELTRALGSRLVDVVDLKLQESVGTWATTNRKNMRRAAKELLGAVGLPPDLRVPKRRTRPTGETVPISFFDVYRYLYLDQNSIDKSVVGHDDANLNIKRVAVFELLYRLSNPRILELAAQRGQYSQAAERARSAARNVADFLRSNAEYEPSVVQQMRIEAESRRSAAEARLVDLRARAEPPAPDSALLSEIADLRNQISAIDADRQAVRIDIDKERGILAQLELDEQAVKREEIASASLTGLEFTRCPRCLQALEREVDDGHCLLCCQPYVAENGSFAVELGRIQDQRRETAALLDEDIARMELLVAQSDDLRQRVAYLLGLAGDRSNAPSDPLLDEVSDASRDLAEAEARVVALTASQARWASHARLIEEAEASEDVARRLHDEEIRLRLEIEESSTKIDDLSVVFNEILADLRDPWYQDAHIDKDSYLPIVDGESFDLLSVGGARKTLVNLAYHLANLSMAISERENVLMPTLLIVDSPRKNVGSGALDQSVVEAVYRRLRTLQDASRGQFQIIIADNELPAGVGDWISGHVVLDYDSPLVPGVAHPGQRGEEVDTIGSEATQEID